jgi:erythronate-4-phosphate dehydrogenase
MGKFNLLKRKALGFVVSILLLNANMIIYFGKAQTVAMPDRLKIVVDDKIPFLKGVLEPYAQVVYLPGIKIAASDVRDAQAVLTRTRTYCTASLLQGSSVRFIGTATIGFDHIDTVFCEKNGIAWTNAPGCNSASVNQYIVASLLEISLKTGRSLSQMTLGVVGVGSVGALVAASAEALGMRVLRCDPPRERREGSRNKWFKLATLKAEADILTFHVPLVAQGSDATVRLVNSSFLQDIKPEAWIINTSRGSVVDNTALRLALRGGSLGGAVLDVWEDEPDIDLSLLDVVEIGTPHIAGYSTDGKANATGQVVRALAKHLGISALENWSVSSLPEPAEPVLLPEGKAYDDEQMLASVYRQCYAVRTDDRCLRLNPPDFEKLRGDYPLRREALAYKVPMAGLSAPVVRKLKALGFGEA